MTTANTNQEQPVYALEIITSAEAVPVLGELLETLDIPPTAITSYTDVDTATGTTYILTDTAAERDAVRGQLDSALPLWLEVLGEAPREIKHTQIRREDWSESWKKYFHTFRVSERLVIKPSWEEYTPEPGDILLEIDPGMCFGTGSHGTTRGCLEYLDQLSQQLPSGATMIDAGCGSGILSIAARKVGFGRIFAFDYDPQAVAVSQENLALAGITDCELAEGDVHTIVPPFQADVAAVNILAHILIEAKENILRLVRPGGVLILSGILDSQYPDVVAAFTAAGCQEVSNHHLNNWATGYFTTPQQ